MIDFLWVWWDARNKANAGDKIMFTEEIVYKVQAMKSFDNLHTHEKANKKQSGISCWSPAAAILKINLDGAYSQREKKGAWGFIVRDHRGGCCDGRCRKNQCGA